MDALSIATGVIAFVDFGSKLISLYREISQARNGLPSELSRLSTQGPELSRNAGSARDKIAELRARYPHQAESFDRLASECILAEKDLQKLLRSFKPGRGTAAFGALRTWWKHDEINSLQERLDNIRDQLNTSIIVCILGTTVDIHDDVGRIINGFDTVQGAIEDLESGLHETSRSQPLQTPSNTDKIATGLWTAINATSRRGNLAPVQASRSYVGESAPTNSSHTICSTIVEALAFPDMMTRENQVKEPFPTTFEWLLKGANLANGEPSSSVGGTPLSSFAQQRTRHPQGQGFKAWLESPDNKNPFWITGKPASGKTTIMKYICTNPKVQAFLRLWAGDLELLTCSVYFWNPGSSEQKSQAGLLRTMLHQLLGQRPELCSLVTPQRYLYFRLAGANAPNPDWTIKELQEALDKLGSQIYDTARLAIFIDGLDEYDGDLTELVGFIKKLHHKHKAKLCVSSRPWNTFKDAFKTYPSLRMEQHTRPDIEKYIRERMAGSDGLQELRRVKLRNRNIVDLESQLVEKADGVFLWVVLVVEQLLIAARDNPDIDKIWELFEALPPDLGKLYASMRSRLSDTLLAAASQMYQLVFRWKDTVEDIAFSADIFWMAISCNNPAESPKFPDAGDMAGIIPVLERKVAGCTGGMLQIIRPTLDGEYVEFIHRTAFDWLRIMWSTVVNDGPPDYDPSLIILSCLAPPPNSLWSPIHRLDNFQVCKDFFLIGRTCNDLQESRRVLLRLIDRVGRPILESYFGQTFSEEKSEVNLRSAAAIENYCWPYLLAKLESGTQIESANAPIRLLQLVPRRFWSTDTRNLRELTTRSISAIGPQCGIQDLNLRLRTTKVLMQAGLVHTRQVVKDIERKIRRNEWPLEYWKALLAGLQGGGFDMLPSGVELKGDTSYTNDDDTDDDEFRRPPLRVMTAVRGNRARSHSVWGKHRNLKQYMHDKKAKLHKTGELKVKVSPGRHGQTRSKSEEERGRSLRRAISL